MPGASFLLARRWRAAAVLSVVLTLAGCATAPGGESRATAPQPVSRAESAYPATPFARIETGMHVANVWRIDVDAAERFPGSEDKTVRVWDLATGTLQQTLRVPIDEVGKIYAVAISPDGATVAAGGLMGQPGQQKFVYLFDRESGVLRQHIGGLEDVVLHLAFSRDRRRLAATLGGKKGLRVYEPPAGKGFLQIAITETETGPVALILRRTAGW